MKFIYDVLFVQSIENFAFFNHIFLGIINSLISKIFSLLNRHCKQTSKLHERHWRP